MTCECLRAELTAKPDLSIPGVCSEYCHENVTMVITGPALSKEESIIQAAVQKMVEFQGRKEDRNQLAEFAMQMTVTEDGHMHPKAPAI